MSECHSLCARVVLGRTRGRGITQPVGVGRAMLGGFCQMIGSARRVMNELVSPGLDQTALDSESLVFRICVDQR